MDKVSKFFAKGKVINTIDNRTVSVMVSSYKKHPIYKKIIQIKKKYLCDKTLEDSFVKDSDVYLYHSAPISKKKNFVIKKHYDSN